MYYHLSVINIAQPLPQGSPQNNIIICTRNAVAFGAFR
jgi:hypothetical protein